MWRSIEKVPYVRALISNQDKPTEQILEPLSKMTEGNKKQYITDVKVMNYLLQAIPNDIYNSVDACKNAKDMWERIKMLMFGFDVTFHVRHLRLMDDFDEFAAKEGESLESVYERLTIMVNIMDRNNVCLILVSINTKFLNCLKPEWSKICYHDEYQGELQGDSQEDKLTTAMMLLAQAITQKFSTPTNNCLCTSLNTRNQDVIQDGRVDIQTKNAADENDESKPSYNVKGVSEVDLSNKVHEQVNRVKHKTIIHTSNDDQIDSNIIFDDPYVENNGGTSEHDSNAQEVQEMKNFCESMEPKVAEKSPKENVLQNEIDQLLEVSLTREIRHCVLISVEKQKNEMLRNELEKSSSDSKDIQANLLKRIKILKNEFKRSQAQSVDFELKLQHQKEKTACDVTWKSRLSTLNDENMLLKS
nr:hypothetical protein [Tanacetum cinerariifolium]